MNFKFQILDTLYFEYYNNNHYTFAYNQSIPDSVLYCSRRRYRWGWYIFEFLVDSYTTGVLSTSLLKIFLLHLEIQYLALHFLGFYDYFLNKCFFCKFQILGTLKLVPGSWLQLVPDSTLYCLRRYYRWCWYIFEFLGDSLATGILRTSFCRVFLLLLEIFLGSHIFILWINIALWVPDIEHTPFQIVLQMVLI